MGNEMSQGYRDVTSSYERGRRVESHGRCQHSAVTQGKVDAGRSKLVRVGKIGRIDRDWQGGAKKERKGNRK